MPNVRFGRVCGTLGYLFFGEMGDEGDVTLAAVKNYGAYDSDRKCVALHTCRWRALLFVIANFSGLPVFHLPISLFSPISQIMIVKEINNLRN